MLDLYTVFVALNVSFNSFIPLLHLAELIAFLFDCLDRHEEQDKTHNIIYT